jgi:putative hydrolase of the HAD superfamily
MQKVFQPSNSLSNGMSAQKRFEYVIIDLDGTLIDESSRLDAQASAVSEKFGSTLERKQNVIDAFFTIHNEVVKKNADDKNNIPLHLRQMGELLGVPVSDDESIILAQRWSDAYEQSFHVPKIFTDTIAFLKELKERGYSLILATGGEKLKKSEVLVRLGIDSFFDQIFTTSEIGFQKQDRRFWEAVLNTLMSSPEKVLVIGNQINDDVWRTKELGMKTVLVKRPDILVKHLDPETVKPDYEVTALRAILNFI